MGVSVSAAAIIVFIGAAAFIASTANLTANLMYSFANIASSLNSQYNRAYTRIEIANVTISDYRVTLLVKNLGPETIFLLDQGYRWCSLIISYNSTLGWITYLLDDYNVTGIISLNLMSVIYEGAGRSYIGPGEGGWLTAKLPEGAPEIPNGSPVVIVFSTRFGESSKMVVVKDD